MSSEHVVSVRQMVEFVLRSGDIDGGFSSVRRAQEGTRLHQKLQRQAMKDSDYRKEVYLSTEVQKEQVRLTVEGRADGIFTRTSEEGEPLVIIDEIKSVTEELDEITEETHPLHWAQAACYAYMYALEEDLTQVEVRLTYIHAETESVRYLYHAFSLAELEAIFQRLTDLYFVWVLRQDEWEQLRDRSLSEVSFPFPAYRPGQRAMAAYVFNAIRDGVKAFLQAPTGIGKTISALFPAIKAMEAGLTDKVFYITAKHTTGLAAMDAAARLQANGARIKIIEISSKDSMCPLEKRSCHPADCPMARGHFDRVNQAALEILSREDRLTSDQIRAWAEQYQVCPFELSLDLSTWADVVICDYNYVFDPSASLKRFFSERRTNYTVLVDEAHNLVDRARDMYSETLEKEAFLKLKKALKDRPMTGSTAAMKACDRVNKIFLRIKKECPEESRYSTIAGPPDDLILALRRFNESMELVLQNWHGNAPDDWLDVYFASLSFIRVAEQMDEHYITYVDQTRKSMSIKLFCYHPAGALNQVYQILGSVIFFSATLMPAPYYKEFLGATEEDLMAGLPSPFDPARRLIMIDDSIPLTYQHRDANVGQVAQRIHEAVHVRAGSYFIFFPSFAYMRKVLEAYRGDYPEDAVIEQETGMSDEARLAVLSQMQDDGTLRLVFAVLGGVFSESVDLVGDRLIGAIIVTVGLPQIGFERDQIRAQMDERLGEGFAYAYSYPGMGKVLQAAGRVIRTEEDKGLVLLIDERYRNASYQKLLPADWFPIRRVDATTMTDVIKRFWSE
ncbi:MAG: ATP-dependent DNA helicase [Clostridiales bacterium]|nr:ATP-dependent DNA helicase [Clostridiales bacterium]